MKRKEKALAEAAALLVLSKNKCNLGGYRGRKISASECSEAIKFIDEAFGAGAWLDAARDRLGITERTYYRWQALLKKHGSYEDRRTFADHSNPSNKISPE